FTNTGSLNFLASPTKASVKSLIEEYSVLNKGILFIVRLNQLRIGSVTKVVNINPTNIRIQITINKPPPGMYNGCPFSSSRKCCEILSALSSDAKIQIIRNTAPATGTTTSTPLIK